MSAADRDQAREWLALARQDLTMAEQALALEPALLRPALFHAQQAAEKALKAVLARAGVVPPRTHDLVVLWTAAGRVSSLGDAPEGLDGLSAFAVDSRYPGHDEDYERGDADAGLALARDVVGRVGEVLDEG